MSDVMLAMAQVRRAIEKERSLGGVPSHTTNALEKLADVVDGLIAALNAEPGLRIDYEQVDAPAKLRNQPAPRSGT